jgi:hypothetical protein
VASVRYYRHVLIVSVQEDKQFYLDQAKKLKVSITYTLVVAV